MADGGAVKEVPVLFSGPMVHAIYGGLMCLFGAALLKITFDATDAPSNPTWVWLCAGVWLCAAAYLIIQGTVLILTSQWLA